MGKDKKAAWIWYPGDFEVWLHREVSMRRNERQSIVPPFWRVDTHYNDVQFTKTFELSEQEEVSIFVEGRYNIQLDQKYLYETSQTLVIPKGKHDIIIRVISETIVPAILIQGTSLISDNTWNVSNNNHKWLPAASWLFHTPEEKPSEYKLNTQEIKPTSIEVLPIKANLKLKSLLLDFGKETFGYVRLLQIKGSGKVAFYYGESREEALSIEGCETLDEAVLEAGNDLASYPLSSSRAFRYIQVVYGEQIQIGEIDALYEYLPVEYRGQFRCPNEKLNKIWNTSLYTMHLTTREFYLDGIKRDRWVWSGDAYQSFLMNYYTFFDTDVSRRTLVALRGKDPIETHINHILDDSFYWVMGMYDYYLYTGDLAFIKENYSKIISLLQFCIGRANADGFMEGYPEDWVFVDWADIDNKGEVSFEQVLFCRSLEIGELFSSLFDDQKQAVQYKERAEQLKQNILTTFWDEELGGLVHSRKDGLINRHLTKYANIFALSFGYFDEAQANSVKEHVLLSPTVQPILTPYMRFYELESLCKIGETSLVLEEMLSYWGGMLELGATTFWETFDPSKKGVEHYEMYGRPFGKSLCHAWGASPLYLIGKYYLGVSPLAPGYTSYLIEPQLGGLEWLEGSIPLPSGNIELFISSTEIKLKGDAGIGTLRFRSKVSPLASHGTIKALDDQSYELEILPALSYFIQYLEA